MKQINPSTTKDLNLLSRFIITAFPQMNAGGQHLARSLYQQLAQGQPVSLAQWAKELDQPLDNVKAVLDSWGSTLYNDANEIIGFWGITVDERRHRMIMAGKTSHAWCAWDTLFIPELVGVTAEISSSCVTTGQTINLTITSQGVRNVDPGIRVSFLLPTKEKIKESVTTSFCHYVTFFASPEAGEQWTAQHDGTFLLTVDEAYEVGKRVNAIRYCDVL